MTSNVILIILIIYEVLFTQKSCPEKDSFFEFKRKDDKMKNYKNQKSISKS